MLNKLNKIQGTLNQISSNNTKSIKFDNEGNLIAESFNAVKLEFGFLGNMKELVPEVITHIKYLQSLIDAYNLVVTKARVALTEAGIPETIDDGDCYKSLHLDERIKMLDEEKQELHDMLWADAPVHGFGANIDNLDEN
jgi:hypothetical protein